ncbi:HNH endonuclease signature motif containing protein [Streptomyces sp. ME01-24h]|nr:HNH endonuclease signature motif containing protein [Streptomyces sp. ME19-03-3]MDX3356898.1 HNH endonuclease signature motif containing protein [Streptomyces sp. ME01-24h]
MLERLGQPLGSGPLGYLRERLKHYGIDTVHFVEEPLPSRPPQRYTREVLEEAAARCRSVREILEHLGVPPYDSAHRHIERRLTHFGIDTSHFVRTPPTRQQPIGARRLGESVAVSTSLAGVVRLLGLPDNGTTRRRVKRAITEHGLSTAHFTGQAHARGVPSPRRKPAEETLRLLAPGSPRTSRRMLHRALQEKGVPYQCTACGTGPAWQGFTITLEIDHVNGDRLDNRIDNLRYLCPSCHSQTRTYAGRDVRAAVTVQADRLQ